MRARNRTWTVLWAATLWLLAGCSSDATRQRVVEAASAAPSPPASPSADSPKRIRATGTIQAVRASTVRSPAISGRQGRMTLVRLIANGARVNAGDLLVEFDPTQQLDDAREAKAKFEDLSHQIEQKKAESRSNGAQRVAQIREAEADLDKAKLQLRKGPLLSEIDRLKNEAKAEGAAARVDSLKKSHALREKAEASAVRILELQRERQKIALERAQLNLERLVIKAQHGGMIALVNTWRSGSMGPPQEGDQVWPGQGLLRIFDPTLMVVEATVNQADSGQLKPGSTAKVALDAYPGAVFDATLEFASPVASSGLDSPIKFFPARFRLLQTDPRLLPDLSAAVDIQP